MYIHQEFPKWVTPEDGTPVIVNNEDEEHLALTGKVRPPEAPKPAAFFNAPSPPYEHQEYPKWVTPEGKVAILVNNKDEEDKAKGEPADGEHEPDQANEDPLVAAAEVNERAALVAKAEREGTKIDGRWGLAKLRDVVNGKV